MESYVLNKINIFLNHLSGNYFPFNSNDVRNSMGRKCYMVFTWIFTIIFFVSGSIVMAFVPGKIYLQSNMLSQTIVVEEIIIGIYINIRLSLLQKMITKMHVVFIENDMLKDAISQTLDPISQPIKTYAICNIFGASLWSSLSFFKLYNQEQFTYTDFTITAYFPFEPFGRTLFAFFAFIHLTGSFYTAIRKLAIDIYVVHIIIMLTAQYKYLRNDLANILDNGETSDEQHENKMNVKDCLKTWIKHHQTVIEISKIFKDFTAPNVLVTFWSCTFSLCFLAYMIIKVELVFFQKSILIVFAGGCLMQLLILCYCVQELSDSSVSVTTKAFYGKWFTHSQWTRKTFSIIIAADEIRSRLSAFGIINLSLATFTQIINHAYSGCLILQKAD